ncbi:lipase-like [Bradysia coprophila]|uniref:lipase-like n=1 Tax=Bradysia coprophila TaxID=38358 RepID=UPI00187D9CC7|nr:lipase-like [Bradysia coprophila]
MIFSTGLLVAYMAVSISGQLSTDISFLESVADVLISVVGTVNSFNGPASISHAPTSPASNKRATQANVRYYNNYAQASYCSNQLKTLGCLPCMGFKKDINTNNGVAVFKNILFNTLAFVTVSDSRKEIAVTFRGTIVDLRNYLLDAAFFNVGFGNIKFHFGFYVATMSLYNNVIQAIGYQLQQHPTYKLVIIGHSLGGAMARLTAFFIKINYQFPGATIELYTYGEPRVGNKAFADYCNSWNILSARCVNKNDVVPHVPPTSLLGTDLLYNFYVHPQLEVWIQSDRITNCNDKFYEDPACSDISDPSYTIDDHINYFNVTSTVCGEVVMPAFLPMIPPALPTKIVNFAGGAIRFQ